MMAKRQKDNQSDPQATVWRYLSRHKVSWILALACVLIVMVATAVTSLDTLFSFAFTAKRAVFGKPEPTFNLSLIHDGAEASRTDAGFVMQLAATLWNNSDNHVSISGFNLRLIDVDGLWETAGYPRTPTEMIDVDSMITAKTRAVDAPFTFGQVLRIPPAQSESVHIPIRLPRGFVGEIGWTLGVSASSGGVQRQVHLPPIFIGEINDSNRRASVVVRTSEEEAVMAEAIRLVSSASASEMEKWATRRPFSIPGDVRRALAVRGHDPRFADVRKILIQNKLNPDSLWQPLPQ
jgi:hypothetical protein